LNYKSCDELSLFQKKIESLQEQKKELEKENIDLSQVIKTEKQNRELAENKLVNMNAEILEIRQEFNRLDSIHQRRTGEELKNLKNSLNANFNLKESKFKSALDSKNRKLAVLKEIIESEDVESSKARFSSPRK
ncbi:MAG: hypothetical protein MHPSP_001565, partial [Paramarteilia canceri]